MPHPDNSNWMSMLMGRTVEAPKRTRVEDFIASRDMFDLRHLNVDLPENVSVQEDVRIWSGPDRDLTAEVYTPSGTRPLSAFLYIHGGGWCVGSAINERKFATRLAAGGFLVVSPDYALAPERPFPAALIDCLRAVDWIVNHANQLGCRSGEVHVGGLSAGANLAAATTVALSEGGQELLAEVTSEVPPEPNVVIRSLLLISGIFSFPLMLEEPGSNAGTAELWNQAYLGPNFLRINRHPLASPAFAPNLQAFPPTYACCGDEDSLLGQSLLITKKLAAANVPISLSVAAGADHAHILLDHVLPNAGPEVDRIVEWQRQKSRST